MTKKTLTLNLHRRWFEMIHKGMKTEEYRAVTPYWCQRFLLLKVGYNGYRRKSLKWWKSAMEELGIEEVKHIKSMLNCGVLKFEKYKDVRFLNGMRPPVPEFRIDILDIKIGKGRKPLGAEKGKDYFVVILNKETIDFKKNCSS